MPSRRPKDCSRALATHRNCYCHMDAGYKPIQHVFGNIAYSMGVGGGILGSLKTLARGEIREFSDVFNRTRHAALDRVVGEALRRRGERGRRHPNRQFSAGPVRMK